MKITMSLSTTFGCPFEGPRARGRRARFRRALPRRSASTASRSPTPPAWPTRARCASLTRKVLSSAFRRPTRPTTRCTSTTRRGMGLANVVAGIEAGVRSFDGSVSRPRRLPVRAGRHRQHLHRGHGEHARGHGLRHARRSRQAAGGRAAHSRRRRPRRARPGDEGGPDARAARPAEFPETSDAKLVAYRTATSRGDEHEANHPGIVAVALGARASRRARGRRRRRRRRSPSRSAARPLLLPAAHGRRAARATSRTRASRSRSPTSPAAPQALQALVGGSADMVSGAYEHTINMVARSSPSRRWCCRRSTSSIVLLHAEGQGGEVQAAART